VSPFNKNRAKWTCLGALHHPKRRRTSSRTIAGGKRWIEFVRGIRVANTHCRIGIVNGCADTLSCLARDRALRPAAERPAIEARMLEQVDAVLVTGDAGRPSPAPMTAIAGYDWARSPGAPIVRAMWVETMLFEGLGADLPAAARVALTVTVLSFVVMTLRALRRAPDPRARRLVAAVLGAELLVAALFAHTPLSALLTRLFPVGAAVGAMLAVGSLAYRPTREAFASIDDGDARALLGFRATFGAFLFAFAALGLMPPVFALTAGLGDLAVGWAAMMAPGSLGRGGSRAARVLVHGLGFVDLVQVMMLALTVVVPWSAAHGNAAVMMPLPWVAVPLMLAINLHGLRQALGESSSPTAGQPVGDGPKPAGGVRGALRRA
jgi:hypothetical protein